jgi:hypothetical protein
VAAADVSGRGVDETCMVILGELNGILFGLHIFASLEGYAPATLKAMASLCVQYNVKQFYHEGNFGDGMFGQLFGVELRAAWVRANAERKSDKHGGTEMIELKSSSQVTKEKRILAVLEPITQSHRLVLSDGIIEEDHKLVTKMAVAEEHKHKYSMMWQYTHITRERHSLANDDRLETLAMACSPFAEAMGIDPVGMAQRAVEEQREQELQDMFEDADEVSSSGYRGHKVSKVGIRVKAAEPSRR